MIEKQFPLSRLDNIMDNLASQYRADGVVAFPLGGSPFSDEEWDGMRKLIPEDLSHFEYVGTGDTKESAAVHVLRLLHDGCPPVLANPSIAGPLVDIFGSAQRLAFYEGVTGESGLMIRRSQAHVIGTGGHVGYHKDSDSSHHYIAAVVLQFEAADDGGDFIVYHADLGRFVLRSFSMVITQADLPHEVSRVEKGQRLSLVFWLSKKTDEFAPSDLPAN